MKALLYNFFKLKTVYAGLGVASVVSGSVVYTKQFPTKIEEKKVVEKKVIKEIETENIKKFDDVQLSKHDQIIDYLKDNYYCPETKPKNQIRCVYGSASTEVETFAHSNQNREQQIQTEALKKIENFEAYLCSKTLEKTFLVKKIKKDNFVCQAKKAGDNLWEMKIEMEGYFEDGFFERYNIEKTEDNWGHLQISGNRNYLYFALARANDVQFTQYNKYQLVFRGDFNFCFNSICKTIPNLYLQIWNSNYLDTSYRQQLSNEWFFDNKEEIPSYEHIVKYIGLVTQHKIVTNLKDLRSIIQYLISPVEQTAKGSVSVVYKIVNDPAFRDHLLDIWQASNEVKRIVGKLFVNEGIQPSEMVDFLNTLSETLRTFGLNNLKINLQKCDDNIPDDRYCLEIETKYVEGLKIKFKDNEGTHKFDLTQHKEFIWTMINDLTVGAVVEGQQQTWQQQLLPDLKQFFGWEFVEIKKNDSIKTKYFFSLKKASPALMHPWNTHDPQNNNVILGYKLYNVEAHYDYSNFHNLFASLYTPLTSYKDSQKDIMSHLSTIVSQDWNSLKTTATTEGVTTLVHNINKLFGKVCTQDNLVCEQNPWVIFFKDLFIRPIIFKSTQLAIGFSPRYYDWSLVDEVIQKENPEIAKKMNQKNEQFDYLKTALKIWTDYENNFPVINIDPIALAFSQQFSFDAAIHPNNWITTKSIYFRNDDFNTKLKQDQKNKNTNLLQLLQVNRDKIVGKIIDTFKIKVLSKDVIFSFHVFNIEKSLKAVLTNYQNIFLITTALNTQGLMISKVLGKSVQRDLVILQFDFDVWYGFWTGNFSEGERMNLGDHSYSPLSTYSTFIQPVFNHKSLNTGNIKI